MADQSTYEPKPAISKGGEALLISAGVGTLVSAAKNALDKHNHGAMGVFTRSGSTIGYFAAVGGVFAFTEAAVANVREKDDAVNGIAGGCAAGFLIGVRARSLPLAAGSCLLLGSLIGTFDAAGKSLVGDASGARKARTAQERELERLSFFKQRPTATEVEEGVAGAA